MTNKSEEGHDYWPKVQHIVPIYLAIGILTVTSLLAIRMLFSEYLPGIEIKEDLWEYWIPLAFPILPIAIWLRPRIRILKFEKEADNRRFLINMIAVISMAIPSVIAQNYVLRANAELTEVQNISEIDVNRPSRYYTIQDFEVLRNRGGAYGHVSVDRRGSNMNFRYYFAYPITSPDQGYLRNHEIWYGLVHHKRISNRVSDEEKEREYELTYDDGEKMVRKHDFRDQRYFEVIQASDERDRYRRAVEARTKNSATDSVVILVPGDGAFQDRTGEQLDWIYLSAGMGLAAFLFFLIWPSYDAKELRRQRRGDMPKGELVDGFKEFFVPRDDYFAAPIILDAIIIVFLIVTFSGVHLAYPSGSDLLEWGANRRAETAGGQWWRLVTSMFLHGGFLHLLMNIYGLLLAAIFVEPIFGRVRFFVIYFLSGICGSLASIWWYENTVSVGASGAIFGLFGAIFSLGIMGVLRLQNLMWLWFFIGINLLFGLTGGIDNAAHIGGLLSGAIIGLMLQLFSRPGHGKNE